MTNFKDGPAEGVTLMLQRAPKYLRVCYNKFAKKEDNAWDALDQLDDEPKRQEKLFVYRLIVSRGHVHIRACRPARSGFYEMADYGIVKEQPDDATMRDKHAWQKWCYAEHEKELKAK